MATLNFPSSYLAYKRKKTKTHNIELAEELNRFCYRYRLAKSFSGLIAPEVGKTLNAYSIVTKAFLAVTAYELIVTIGYSLKVHKKGFTAEFYEPLLADSIRENLQLRDLLDSYLDPKKPLKDEVKNFFNSASADVNCIAFGLRHVFAHGNLTISAAGMGKAQHRNDIAQLAEATLKYADELFSQFVAQL